MNMTERIEQLRESAKRNHEIANKYLTESRRGGPGANQAAVKEERYRSKASEDEAEIRKLGGHV